MINIGPTIKKYREHNNVTQLQLAEKVKVTPTYISALENNRKDPSLSLLNNISKELNVPMEIIFWDSINDIKNLENKDKEILDIAKNLVSSYYKSDK